MTEKMTFTEMIEYLRALSMLSEKARDTNSSILKDEDYSYDDYISGGKYFRNGLTEEITSLGDSQRQFITSSESKSYGLRSSYAARIISKRFEELRQTKFPFLAYTTVELEHDSANLKTRVIFRYLRNNYAHVVQQVVTDSTLYSVEDLEGFIEHLVYNMSLKLSYIVYNSLHDIYKRPLII